jgi:hypothetical protein
VAEPFHLLALPMIGIGFTNARCQKELKSPPEKARRFLASSLKASLAWRDDERVYQTA